MQPRVSTSGQDPPIKTLALLRRPAICQCRAACLMMVQCCRDGGSAKDRPLTGHEGHNALQLLSTINIFHSLNIPWLPVVYKAQC